MQYIGSATHIRSQLIYDLLTWISCECVCDQLTAIARAKVVCHCIGRETTQHIQDTLRPIFDRTHPQCGHDRHNSSLRSRSHHYLRCDRLACGWLSSAIAITIDCQATRDHPPPPRRESATKLPIKVIAPHLCARSTQVSIAESAAAGV